MQIREMNPQDRPAYRAEENGVKALATCELLQIISRSLNMETCQEMMAEAKTVKGLAQMSLEEKTVFDGIGKAGALAIEAALELGRRQFLESGDRRIPLHSDADVARILMANYGNEMQEYFVVVMVDIRNRIIGIEEVYKGSNCASPHMRMAEIFRSPILKGASGIIVAHNHPSGDPTASPEDVEITRQIRKAGDQFDIELLDHVIVAGMTHCSLRRRGLGFDR